MKHIWSLLLISLLILTACSWTGAAEFTAVTIFGCGEDGSLNSTARWNSGPVDAAWDIFIYQGEIAKSSEKIQWLNDPQTKLVKFSPADGTTTYTFHFDCSGEIDRFGLNLFGDGQNSPLISVYASVSTDITKCGPSKVNSSTTTMGWPIADVPASCSRSYDGINRSMWAHDNSTSGKKYTITDFKVFTPGAAGNLDFVGPGESSPSGRADYVGQFTIKVEDSAPAPQDWLLWTSTIAEMNIGSNKTSEWKKKYDYQNAQPPFSFTFGGKSSRELLKNWKFTASHNAVDANRTAHNLVWQDPASGLEMRWAGIEYNDFESIEWTIYLTNNSKTDSPIIEDIKALDLNFVRGKDSEYKLRHWNGTFITADDYAPKSTTLDAGKSISFSPSGHRQISTAGVWPYYNIDAGNEGVIVVVSWSGNWQANFQRDNNIGLHVTAGQKISHFKLKPGETVRTPLVVMQFWKGGDWIDSQNTWRKWMIKHNIPRRDNKQLPLPMFNACSSHQFAEMTKANEQNQKEFLDSYLAKGLKLDYWWMDAGWYVGAAEKGWVWTGTWEVDRSPHRFPNGLRAISDYAHKKDVKIILWFEPERVAGGTWLTTEHPEWVLGGAGGGLLNLGNPEAWNWLVNHVDKILTDEGIDLYRQDYNIDPFPFWQGNDAPDRQGITENKYVMGYLAYWDELLKRHPGMLIDSCASGGHRNDLETMRRGVPLTRSDYLFEPVGQQGHTYGLSFWLPFHGTGYNPSNASGWGWGTGEKCSYDPYTRRSNMCPSNTACFDFRVAVDDKLIMNLYKEWLEIGPAYFGDFYPLLDYNISEKDWMAWQFNRPESGEGFIQAFRRSKCVFAAAQLKLRGLDPDAVYLLKNYDVEDSIRMSGRQLMEQGIDIKIPQKPGAATIKYSRQ